MATVRNLADDSAVVDKSYDNNRFSITPSDTVALPVPIQALYTDDAGKVAVRLGTGEEAIFEVADGGPYYVGGVTHVLATGTTALGIYGLASKGLR